MISVILQIHHVCSSPFSIDRSEHKTRREKGDPHTAQHQRIKLRFLRLNARWSFSHCRYPCTLPIFSP